MEETKIWAVEGTSATPLNTTNQMESEGLLEDILTANPDMLEEGLQLVGRQTSTVGGPLDLLGVDNYGKLVVFELKRGTLNREAVAQVIDYASSLNEMDSSSLFSHIAERSGNLGIQKIDDFGGWYNTLQENSDLPDEDTESLTPPRIVLVGLGVDDTTERMVKYMADSGMDISLLTFYGFVNIGGKTLLARNVEVTASDITPRRQPSNSAAERRRIFEERVANLGVLDTFYAARDMFREQFRYHFETASRYRVSFNRDRRAYLFIEIDEDNKCIMPGFHPRAIDLALDEFNEIKPDGIFAFRGPAQNATHTDRVDYEFKFPLSSLNDWYTQMNRLTSLTQSVFDAYQTSRSK